MRFETYSRFYDKMKSHMSLEAYAAYERPREDKDGPDNISALWSTVHTDVYSLRTDTKLSQVKFAARYGIPTRTLEDWEAGKSNPTPYLIKLIAYTVYMDYILK